MSREDLDRELDEWLNRAAAEYGRAEIRPGFENRIIAKLNSRLERRRLYLRWIPVAAACAAVLVFSVHVFRTNIQDSGRTDIVSQRPAKSESRPAQGLYRVPRPGKISTEPPTKGYTGRRARRKASQARRGRFLSSGLSDQERYLMAFAQAASKQSSIGISEDTKFKPLQIPKAEIPEFTIPDFEISSFENVTLRTLTPGSEEKS
jgi:hypothetical protein